MASFPSLEWLENARDEVNRDSTLRKLGSCDVSMGVKAGSATYAVVFEAFECTDVLEITEGDLRDLDFYIDMSKTAWTRFLRSLKGKQPQSLDVMDLEKGVVKSFDAARRLAFLRYNQSIQTFFARAVSA
mgnify:CR=1 FL=1|jgi:hypothetical protein|tara:strand:- start:984 stop:1373 length:390 start_codon:yes stop_codon:yes gene_type:complete